MSTFNLEAKSRQVGKGSELTALRNNSQVPGVVYGLKGESQVLVVDYGSLLKILTEAGTSNIINLKVDGQDNKVIVRDWQQDPITEKLIHVDFLKVNDQQPITTKVPLEFVGASRGVKEKGGKLDIKEIAVKVKCLSANLPAKIQVDISGLEELGQVILIKDLLVDDQVSVLNNPTDPVVSVIVPKKILEAQPETVAQPTEGEAGVETTESEKSAEGEGKAEAPETADKDQDKNKENK